MNKHEQQSVVALEVPGLDSKDPLRKQEFVNSLIASAKEGIQLKLRNLNAQVKELEEQLISLKGINFLSNHTNGGPIVPQTETPKSPMFDLIPNRADNGRLPNGTWHSRVQAFMDDRGVKVKSVYGGEVYEWLKEKGDKLTASLEPDVVKSSLGQAVNQLRAKGR